MNHLEKCEDAEKYIPKEMFKKPVRANFDQAYSEFEWTSEHFWYENGKNTCVQCKKLVYGNRIGCKAVTAHNKSVHLCARLLMCIDCFVKHECL